ncbi:hypothetical protein VPH35_046957 [Triticum aestivum]
MPLWKDGEESSEEEELVDMDVEQHWDGIDCGVAQWVDAPWPSILQRFLVKIWKMFHEENHGRMIDHEKYKKELDKVNKQLDTLGDRYSQLVEDVSKMFDWADQNNKVMSDEELKQK